MTENELSKLFEEIEMRLIASLKRNLTKHKAWEKDLGFQWTAWQADKISNIDKYRRQNERIMNKYKNVINEEIRTMLSEQFAEGKALTTDALLQTGRTTADIVTNENFFDIWDEKLESLIEEVQGKAKTAETASLRMMNDVYRQTLLRANMALQTGSMTVPQAIELAVKEFSQKGINCIEYRDGRRVNIVEYVQMALRTSNTRAALMGGAKQRELIGIDTVRVSSYGGCSETCLPWQGKIYIDDVYGTFDGEIYNGKGKSRSGKWYMLLSVAIDAGLFHPNCRHTLTTYFEGAKLSPELDGEQIRKNYKLEQQQRAKEREIRKWKRMEAVTDDPMMKEVYKNKIKEAQGELKSFVAEHKDILRQDPWRENTYGIKDESIKKSANRNDIAQYERYKSRLGDYAPATFEEFQKLKYTDEKNWTDLQTEYRFQGIINRLLEKYPNARYFSSPDEIPDEYNLAARAMTDEKRNAILGYTRTEEGIRINRFLGGDSTVILSPKEHKDLEQVEQILNQCCLPHDTVLWRAADSRYLTDFNNLDWSNPKSLKGTEFGYAGFSSSSIIKEASYIGHRNKDTIIIGIKKGQQRGATYVEEISYNKLNNLKSEYEALLQNNIKYSTIEGQRFKGKYIVVAEVL